MFMRSHLRKRFQACGSAATVPHRRGFTLVELTSAMILLGVVFTVSISILAAVARERRSAEQRQFALQHATNLLERITGIGWSKLSPGTQKTDPLPAELQALLPNFEQHVEVTTLPEELNSKLVSVSVSWKNREGQVIAPVHLSAWVYPLGEVPE